MSKRAEPLYARRYLWRGQSAHAVVPGERVAACGFRRDDADSWLGTGSQDEYERAAALPRCNRCLKWLGDNW